MENILRLPTADTGPQAEPPVPARRWGIELQMVPTLDPVAVAGDRAGPLWGLAEGLAADARLTLSYRFDPEVGRPQAAIRLDGVVGDGAAEAVALTNRLVLPRLAALAFPGFAPALKSAPRWRHAIDIPLPSRDLSAPVRTPGPRLAQPRPVEPCLLFPARPLPLLALDHALVALAGMGEAAELAIEIAPFDLDAAARRVLALRHRYYGEVIAQNLSGPLTLLSIQAQVDLLAPWVRHPQGLKLGFALRSPAPVQGPWADVVAQVLAGGDALPQLRPMHDGIDLSDAVTAGVALPPILPQAGTLAALGFCDPRPRRRFRATDGLVLGLDPVGRLVVLRRADCARHTLIVGATGVGKSTQVAAMIARDIAAGYCVILIDPHGDLFAQVRAALAGRPVMLADVADLGTPFGLNLLEVTGPHAAVQRNLIANQLMGVFKSVLYRGCPEAFGPMFEAYFRNALLLLMEVEGGEATLVDFDRVFGDPGYRRGLLARSEDEVVKRFWTDIATRAGGEASLENIAPYIVSKLTQFTGNPLLRPILAQRRSTLDLPGAMARGEVCLVHLAKGLVGPADAALIGGLVCIRILTAAMARAALPPVQRTPVRVYLDEFATYAGDAVAQMLAEARKFGVELVLVTQSLTQIDGHDGGVDIASSVLANVGNILAFRTGPEDARRLADWFAPEVTAETLTRLPDRTMVARLLDQGSPRPPCLVLTDHDRG